MEVLLFLLWLHGPVFYLQVQADRVAGIRGHGGCSCFGHSLYGKSTSHRWVFLSVCHSPSPLQTSFHYRYYLKNQTAAFVWVPHNPQMRLIAGNRTADYFPMHKSYIDFPCCTESLISIWLRSWFQLIEAWNCHFLLGKTVNTYWSSCHVHLQPEPLWSDFFSCPPEDKGSNVAHSLAP